MIKWALSIYTLFFALNISVAEDFRKPTYSKAKKSSFISDEDSLLVSDLPKIKCDRLVSSEVGAVAFFGNNMAMIASLNACAELKSIPFERYTHNYCKLNTDCSKSKYNDLSHYNYPIYLLISQEFLANKLENNIAKMEKMDVLRVFAERKFGKNLASQCPSPFNYNSNEKLNDNMTCESQLVDNAFKKMQDTCKAGSSICYNHATEPEKNYEQFAANFKSTPENENVVQSFFKKINYSEASNYLAVDSEILENLANIISSTEGSDSKIQSIHTKILDYKKSGKLDPILNASDEASVFAFFDKLITDPRSKNLNTATAKKAIEAFRLDTANSILKNSCEGTPQLKNICRDGTSIKKQIKISGLSRDDVARYASKLDNNEDTFNSTKSTMQSIKDKTDYKVILATERCEVLGLNDRKESSFLHKYDSDLKDIAVNPNTINTLSAYPYLDTVNQGYVPAEGSKAFIADIVRQEIVRKRERKEPVIDTISPNDLAPVTTKFNDLNFEKIRVAAPVDKTKSAASSASSSETTAASAPPAASAPTVAPAASAPAKTESSTPNYSNLAAQMAKAETTTPQVQTDYSKSFVENKIADKAAVDEEKQVAAIPTPKNINSTVKNNSQTKVDNVDSSPDLKNKISELTDKLAASEEDVKKLKAEEAEAQKAKLSDLQKEVANLKAENQKAAAASVAAKSSSIVASSAKSPDAEMAQHAEAQAQAISNEAAATAGNAVRSATSSRNTSANQVAEASASRTSASLGASNGSGADTKSGLTLSLKLDGVSSEKESELITNRLLELKTGFLTEKDGVVLQVVPKLDSEKNIIYENGKPLYEIIKPKVAKVALAKASALTSSGELAQAEKEKLAKIRAAARLKELHDLTSSALSLEKK